MLHNLDDLRFVSLLLNLSRLRERVVRTLCYHIATVLPRLKCGQALKSVGYRKPTEFIQDPSRQKTAEDQSPEERASAPGCPLRSGDTKRAGFSAELKVSNVQQAVHKLSGAQHCPAAMNEIKTARLITRQCMAAPP